MKLKTIHIAVGRRIEIYGKSRTYEKPIGCLYEDENIRNLEKKNLIWVTWAKCLMILITKYVSIGTI